MKRPSVSRSGTLEPQRVMHVVGDYISSSIESLTCSSNVPITAATAVKFSFISLLNIFLEYQLFLISFLQFLGQFFTTMSTV